MEPILLREATVRGVMTSFNTEFQSFIQDVNGVTTIVKDILSNNVYQIRSKSWWDVTAAGQKSPDSYKSLCLRNLVKGLQ